MNTVLFTESSVDVARKMKVALESAGVSVYPDPPPGANKIQSVITGITESGVILLLITKTLSQYFTRVVGQAYTQCQQSHKTIIPIFFNVSPDEVQILLTTPALTPLGMYHHVMYDDPGSIEKIVTVIKTPDISESLILISLDEVKCYYKCYISVIKTPDISDLLILISENIVKQAQRK